ncbi:recombinase family protein [Streptomyces lydicus]|uniref:recombinase family protein n=1 Tax=Streptomyces lydicus TaxID=47763 RepID=UPI0037B5C7D1
MRRSTAADDGRPLRVLAACRISNDDDSSSSLERQREKLQEWLHDNPHCTLVHVTEDRSVSGAVDLKDRPELGPWLADGKRDEWDAVWVSTQDRLGRDDLHFMAFVKDLLDWRKNICVHDDPSFDVSTETGRLIAYAKATQAAAELTRIRKRALDSRDYLRRKGLWAGGNLPFGYQPVHHGRAGSGGSSLDQGSGTGGAGVLWRCSLPAVVLIPRNRPFASSR